MSPKHNIAPVFHDLAPELTQFAAEVHAGLAHRPKRIPPQFFYDAAGSALFERICELPEYYPTRCEVEILERHAGDIAARLGTETLLVEFGSGSDRKIRLLLPALAPRIYMPIDISKAHLKQAARQIARDFPNLAVHAVCADYGELRHLPHHPPGLAVTAFFPGSTIGNLEPLAARRFLHRIAGLVGHGGWLLIGVDLKKDRAILDAAYDDAAGVTAEFNANLLRRMNRELDADFDLARFRHRAFYNEHAGRVEMHLVSTCAQTVRVAGRTYAFDAGETIHTENSYKYGIEEFAQLAGGAGFATREVWTDTGRRFSVHLLQVE
jgi:dimethylhistidine N-methyltransferase